MAFLSLYALGFNPSPIINTFIPSRDSLNVSFEINTNSPSNPPNSWNGIASNFTETGIPTFMSLISFESISTSKKVVDLFEQA